MSIDMRCKHDRLPREQAVELFDRRFGCKSVARRLGVPAGTVRKWQQSRARRAAARNVVRGNHPLVRVILFFSNHSSKVE